MPAVGDVEHGLELGLRVLDEHVRVEVDDGELVVGEPAAIAWGERRVEPHAPHDEVGVAVGVARLDPVRVVHDVEHAVLHPVEVAHLMVVVNSHECSLHVV